MSALLLKQLSSCREDEYPKGSLLLNLGSGQKYWDGWVNVDLEPTAEVVADIRRLPYDDNSADAIAAIHVIEHFYNWVVPNLLSEWKRVLKPGGRLILELPSMEKVFQQIQNALNTKTPISPTFSWFPLWGEQRPGDPNSVHKWGYTFQMVTELLSARGFENIALEKPRYHFINRDMRVVCNKPLTT